MQKMSTCLWFDTQKSERVMKAFLQMKKFDIAALERAFEGQ
jgi:predicted 3-demethylubiquinone-9 3-methyltransferase (glyoxalase superfamily)